MTKTYKVKMRAYVPITLAGEVIIEINAKNESEAKDKAYVISRNPYEIVKNKIISTHFDDDIFDLQLLFDDTARERGGITELQFDEDVWADSIENQLD